MKPNFKKGDNVVVEAAGLPQPKYKYNPIKEIQMGEVPKSIGSFEGKIVKADKFDDGYRYNIKGGSAGNVTWYYIKEKFITLANQKTK